VITPRTGIRVAWRWYRSPKTQRRVNLALITMGAAAAKNLLEELFDRVDKLEQAAELAPVERLRIVRGDEIVDVPVVPHVDHPAGGDPDHIAREDVGDELDAFVEELERAELGELDGRG
jgi:hypothetical protein